MCHHRVVSALDAPSPITVAEALEVPALARGVPEIVAGGSALDRRIRWVHSGEVPYMAELIKGDELLLMTGIGIKFGAAEQRRFIAELAGGGTAALVIELGARFRQIPKAMSDEAERQAFPLIALHREIRFVEVTEALSREIVSRQAEQLRNADDL